MTAEEKYYHTKASVEEYIKLAKDVDGRELIQKFREVLPSNSKVLEIGSGPGADWKILSESYEVIGSDNSKFFLDHLNKKHPDGVFLELDATTLNTDHRFDGIYSNKVLHHLNDNTLKESIQRQHDILYPGGMICHSFWKGEGSEVFKGMFVNYHTEKGLNEAFDKLFEIVMIESYNEFEESDSLLLIGRKKLFA